jgi:hypothetical protein
MSETAAKRDVVVVLMKSEEADATISVLEADGANVRITDKGTYWHISATDELVIDMKRVGEELGRPIGLNQWLVVMSTFVGRVETEPDLFRLTSHMLQLEPSSS